LLGAVMDGSADRLTFSSSDPRALPLYLRAGMFPRWPLLCLEGPASFGPSTLHDECVAVGLDVAIATEARLTGSDRTVEYTYWLSRSSTSCVVVGDRAVGVVRHVGDGVRVEHLAVADGADPALALASIGRWANVDTLLAYVRGTSPLARSLLEAGHKVIDADTAMSTRPDLVSDSLHVMHPGLL
jgi:hypothetical protein